MMTMMMLHKKNSLYIAEIFVEKFNISMNDLQS